MIRLALKRSFTASILIILGLFLGVLITDSSLNLSADKLDKLAYGEAVRKCVDTYKNTEECSHVKLLYSVKQENVPWYSHGGESFRRYTYSTPGADGFYFTLDLDLRGNKPTME